MVGGPPVEAGPALGQLRALAGLALPRGQLSSSPGLEGVGLWLAGWLSLPQMKPFS